MNFNVHRRNRSLVGQPSQRERKEGRSLKKVPYACPGEAILSEAKDIYHSQGDLEHAARLFAQYLALYPKNSEALYLCAVCELRTGHYQDALVHLSTLPDDYPHRPNALLLSAMALNKLGKTMQSLQLVNQCVNRYEGFEEAICFRGKLYMGLNYYHRAEQDFRALASKPNSSFLPHNSLGDCYRAQNKPQKAIGPYLRALELLQGGGQALVQQLQLKVGICLYELERWSEARRSLQEAGKGEGPRGCQYYYYMGGCMVQMGERQKGLLNLQYCLRTQGSSRLMRRAFKKLIQLYLQNYQFYEALNVVRLGEISGLSLEGWGSVVQAFMLIIKGSFEDGLKFLNQTILQVKQNEEGKRLLKIKRDSSHGKAAQDSRYNQNSAFSKKLLAASPGRVNPKDHRQSGKIKPGKLGYFSTKSVLRAVPKIQSLRLVERGGLSVKKNDQARVKTQYVEREQGRDLYVGREKEFMVPLILQFKAYAQFFIGNFLQCLDTYEEYQTFIKDNFGRQSDVIYNKSLCQGLLMAQSDMHEQALTKYGACLDIFYQKNNTIPTEPLLYKIILLVKLGIERGAEEQSGVKKIQQQASSKQILQSTLELMENYQPALATSSLALYFRGLVCLLLDQWGECRDWMEKALKIAEDCSWRCLWVKGIVEMRMSNCYEAVKEFSAGLILQSRAELYLGRSICFLLLSEEAERGGKVEEVKGLMRSVHLGNITHPAKTGYSSKQAKNRSDILVQNCFEDLQKYIQLQTRQQDISLWVSKILFRNKAYDQAIRSLVKITHRTPEVTAMIQSISIYEGEFEGGGPVGIVIKSAFEGTYLSGEEEVKLLQGNIHRQIEGGEWLQKDYQKWIVALHLYVKESYTLLLKYLQRELFSCQEGNTHYLLKYNIAITYLLLGEQKKSINVLRSLTAPCLQQKMQKLVARFEQVCFDQDECLQDLREEVGISCSKLLSNYLPYRSVRLGVDASPLRIYVRPSIPFPQFASPSLHLQVGVNFVSEQVVTSAVQKRLQAPWIRKTECKTVQFTQKLQQSGVYLTGETTSVKGATLAGGSFFLQ